MAVATRQGREKPAKMKQKKVQGGVRTSGKTNNTPGWPSLHRTGPGRDKQKEEPKPALSLPCAGVRFSSRLWIYVPSRLRVGFSCYYLNKIEL